MEAPTEKPPPTKTKSAEVATQFPPNSVRVIVFVALTIALLSVPLTFLFLLYQSGDLVVLTHAHAAALLGVPWAGGAAFIVVLAFRTSFGAIDFRVLGTEFKGASGPIVMWVFCFLAEVSAIKLLW